LEFISVREKDILNNLKDNFSSEVDVRKANGEETKEETKHLDTLTKILAE
jgi:hypothetical protein